MRWLYLSLILSNTVLLPRVALATLIADENFNYTSGAALDGQSGAFGFSGPWTVGNGAALPAAPGARTIQAGNLGFATTGNHVFIDSGGENDRNLATSLGVTGQTDYFSFTVRPDSAIDPATSVGLVLGGSENRIFIGKPNVGSTADYVLEQAGGAGQVASATTATQGVAALLVVRANFATGNDTLRLYVNPVPNAPEPATADATLTAFDTASISYLGVNSFGPLNEPLVTGMNASLGEIRIGTTFADVVPEPAIACLCFVGTSLLLRREHSRVVAAT